MNDKDCIICYEKCNRTRDNIEFIVNVVFFKEYAMSSIDDQIKEEIAANKILIYGKGTKAAPQCGFTVETIQFFNKYGYPFEVVNCLEDMTKREALNKMTNWPTLPKVFIDGKFYGDTDILDEMEAKGEVEPLIKAAFGE